MNKKAGADERFFKPAIEFPSFSFSHPSSLWKVASSGKEHWLASLLYLINQLFLCFLLKNKEAAFFRLLIFAFVGLLFVLLLFLKGFHGNERRIFARSTCLFIILEGKVKLFFVFFGLLFQLLLVYGSEPWVRLAETLFLQVAFINIFVFIFRSLPKESSCNNGEGGRIC